MVEKDKHAYLWLAVACTFLTVTFTAAYWMMASAVTHLLLMMMMMTILLAYVAITLRRWQDVGCPCEHCKTHYLLKLYGTWYVELVFQNVNLIAVRSRQYISSWCNT